MVYTSIEIKDQAKLYTGTECDVTASQSIVLAIVLNELQVRYVDCIPILLLIG